MFNNTVPFYQEFEYYGDTVILNVNNLSNHIISCYIKSKNKTHIVVWSHADGLIRLMFRRMMPVPPSDNSDVTNTPNFKRDFGEIG